MFPPIFQLVAAYAPATALLGSNPVRFWPFGQAQVNSQGVVTTPYGVWRVITGLPENFINQRPDIDSFGVQIDVYGDSSTATRNAAQAIRDAIEGESQIVGWRGESIDPDTKRYRYSFDAEFWTPR